MNHPALAVSAVIFLAAGAVTRPGAAQECRVCAHQTTPADGPSWYADGQALWSVALTQDEKPSFWVEAGYVVAMEAVFTGMSFLASRDDARLRAGVGGFDVFMGVAGFGNAAVKKPRVQRVGHFLIGTGFLAKAAYNFHFGRNHSKQQRFLTNYVGFNALVFTGYYLDGVGN